MADSKRPRLLVIAGHDGLPAGALDQVADLVDATVATNLEQIREHLPEAEIVFAWDFRARELAETWPLAKNVRWVQVAAAGVNTVLFPAMVESDAVVTNARGLFDMAMAEYALALMLYFAKNMDMLVANQRTHTWEYRQSEMLEGSTVAVIGLGSIGSTFAQRARALGMRVLGVRRSGAPDDSADEVFPVERMNDAIALADYVVVFVPRTTETVGLIGRASFEAMKPRAVFVNLGRGDVVDEGALLEALQADRIRVSNDVFSQEPLPTDSPLWDAPNQLISPHIGGDDHDSGRRILELFTENVKRYVSGKPLKNQIDKRRGY